MLTKSSNCLSLTPIMDQKQVMRVGGRINKAYLPYHNRHPMILPSDHPLTKGIVIAFHEKLLHLGTDSVLSHIRQHFWIIRGRETVKKISRQCPQCIMEKAKPGQQQMGELLRERMEAYAFPFTRTAINYFGPLEVGYGRNRTTKIYGAIFSCLTTRAVYLDLAASLSTDDFLLALRRFMGTYGKPKTLHSDNGTNFIAVEKELLGKIQARNKEQKIENFLERKGLEWKFQPPKAPHSGGAHESLVRSTKLALYRALEEEKKLYRYPTEVIMRTLLFDIVGLLNSRLLGYSSSDPKDTRPLTPNDFLNRPSTSYNPKGTFSDADPRGRFRYVQRMTNLFWDMWHKAYLQSLIERKKWKFPKRNMVVQDMVLIMEPNQPRREWLTRKITETFKGEDRLVRVVKVKTENREFTRAIHRLCPKIDK